MNNLELATQMQLALYKPETMQEVALTYLEDNHSGTIRVVDPNNPFMSLLETTIATAGASADHVLLNNAKRFAVLADDESELYPHLNIGDITERFSQPSSATFTVRVNYDAIVKYAIDDDDSLYKCIRIPRDTKVVVDGLTFTFTHAIELRLYDAKLKVIYITDDAFTDFDPIDSNVIPYTTIKDAQRYSWIFFDVTLKEHTRNYNVFEVTSSIAFEENIYNIDTFHKMEAEHYINGVWTDLPVNYTFGKFNPTEPELTISVVDTTVNLKVLPLYQENGLIGSQIRVTVFGTSGDVVTDFSGYGTNDFTTSLLNVTRELDVYEKAFSKTSFQIDSSDMTSNGRDMLSFTELKELHLTNSFGQPALPVTDRNLALYVGKTGNTLTKWSNTVAGRTYLSSSEQPVDSSLLPITEIPIGYTTLEGTFNEFGDEDNSILSEDGLRVAMLPEKIYLVDQFDATLVDSVTTDSWGLASDLDINTILNETDYRYSPWVHILTSDGVNVTIDAYDKDNCELTNKSFEDHNTSTNMYVSADSHEVSIDDAYENIVVTTTLHPDPTHDQISLSDLYVQLVFTGITGESRYVTSSNAIVDPISGDTTITTKLNFLNSTTGESGFDIYDKKWLRITNCLNSSGEVVTDHIELTSSIEMIYCATNLPDTGSYIVDDVDTKVVQEALVSYRYGISVETYTLKLLNELTHLYTAIQPTGSDRLYETADEDIFVTYSENVLAPYAYGDNGEHELPFSVDNCTIDSKYEHLIGDYALRNSITHAINGLTLTSPILKVNDISTRNDLTVSIGTVVYVRDAVDDPLVLDSLFAFYYYSGVDITGVSDTWVRVTDYSDYLYRQYYRGDYILDEYNKPIPLSITHYNHKLKIMVLPVAYHYITETTSLQQLSNTLNNVVREATEEANAVDNVLLNNSTIEYKPAVGLGLIKVSTGNGNVSWLDAEVSGSIVVRCEESIVSNLSSQETIKSVILGILDAGFKESLISRHILTQSMLSEFGSSVTAITLNLDVFDDHEVFTVYDKADRFTISKSLGVHSSLTRYVVEDITFEFIAL